ncbi:MAG: hypothetical protein AAFV53_27960 [Myxococcota bacterium]
MLTLISMLNAALAAPVPNNSLLNQDNRNFQVELGAEVGFLAPLSHTIQFGNDGTEFDYVRQGGQDNLFTITRWSADLRLNDRHTVTFLYQPLNLVTTQKAKEDLVFDGILFTEGTGLNLRYGFDFYRASYTYDLLPDDKKEWGIGLSLQIRNATIDFTSADGTLRTTNRDIGPVPIIKTRGRFELKNRAWWGFEADGFYAPIRYLNGGQTDVVGAILDASLRYGVKLNRGIEPFLNLRYLGGGADGTEADPDPGKDGYVRNWLNFATVSIGVYVR